MNGSFFDKIGVADMEKVHSAVIGWIFSDECKALTNQQKSELLCSLFHVMPSQTFNSFVVEVEHHDIDILIITDNDTCWVIENKVKSSQHSNYLCCITNLAKALDDFINNHQQYPYVFDDGTNKKKRTGNYIADNGLETIFQKCFLSHIIGKTKNYSGFDISETHGVALAEKKDVRSVKGYKLGIQFQNGSFKAQILNENSKADAFGMYGVRK